MGTTSSSRRSIEPFDILLVVISFGAAVTVLGSIYDINDLFWHILIGDQIRAGVPISQVGSQFTFAYDNPDWRTGAWASEYLMSWLYDLGGWTLLVCVIRLTSLAAIAVILWRAVVIRFPSRSVALPYFLAMASLALTVQERPQSFSYVFLTVAGVWWYQIVVRGRPPHWLTVGLVALAWANLHGLWIVLPITMILALAGRWVDNGRRDPLLLRVSLLCIISLVAGVITPLGVQGLLLPLQIRGAAKSVISEWQLTALFASPGYLLLIAAGLAIFLLGRVRAPRSQVLFTAVVVVFGLTAVRNVTPAILLLTPLLTSLIDRALGDRAKVSVQPREGRRLRVIAWVTVAIGAISLPIAIAVQDQGPPKTLPIGLVEELAQEGGDIRLFNDFNVAGISLFYGGPDLQVAVDGRTDFFGRDYLERYQDAVLYARDLDGLISDLDPTQALLQRQSGAAALLQAEGWHEIDSEGDYVLLSPP
jgi:hypothetical protein